MPKNKFQEVIFTLIMVFFMVYAMICYNIKPSKNTGGNTNEKENGSSSFDGGNDRITSCRMWGQQEFGVW